MLTSEFVDEQYMYQRCLCGMREAQLQALGLEWY